MRIKIICAVLSVLLLAAAGCEISGSEKASYHIDGLWVFSVQSADNSIAFTNTPLDIVASSDGGASYSASWFWPPTFDTNGIPITTSASTAGTASFDSNTLAVTINVWSATNPPTVLSLSGSMTSPNEMSGGGTINGAHPATWQAER